MKKLLITIPCYNEELVLEKNIFSVIRYAKQNLSYTEWKVFILDNNSSDRTLAIAEEIRKEYPDIVEVSEVRTPGRGIALREAWKRIPGYDIYSYMDADLATDLKDFDFIVKKVIDGYDFVTGSRYLPESEARRTFRRKILSKIYNFILKIVLNVDFEDAQCGFKSFSRRLVAELVPETKDSGWFWDTELMILASRRGYKVLEVPVSWREVRDELRASKVSPWKETIRQLKNIYLMRKRLAKDHGEKIARNI